eukprot:4029173-Amphidinium_carterae.1
MAVLPHHVAAPQGRPRRTGNLSRVIKTHVKCGSRCLADGWRGPSAACKRLRQSNHRENYRNGRTSLHSNDAESDVSRCRLWHRAKWSKVCSLNVKAEAAKATHMEGHVADYLLQTNWRQHMQLSMGVLLVCFSHAA